MNVLGTSVVEALAYIASRPFRSALAALGIMVATAGSFVLTVCMLSRAERCVATLDMMYHLRRMWVDFRANPVLALAKPFPLPSSSRAELLRQCPAVIDVIPVQNRLGSVRYRESTCELPVRGTTFTDVGAVIAGNKFFYVIVAIN